MTAIIRKGEVKLLGAFGILILLTAAIGLVGIAQIRQLSSSIERLAKRNFRSEKAILEMKINNAVYAMGIRNYVFWKVSRYLGAVPMAVEPEKIFAAGERFKKCLKVYEDNALSGQERSWARAIADSFEELSGLGKHIIDLADNKPPSGSPEDISNLLMVFENRLYKIDNFLDNTVSAANLSEIEQQLVKTVADKRKAVILLIAALAGAVAIGGFIAGEVSRRRIRERLYRQQLFNQMINLEENERKTLSAEIHDQLGQDLSALKISLGLVSQKLPSLPTEVKKRLEEAREITSKLIAKSHDIAYLLRPPSLDEVGLVESIEELLIEYGRLTSVKYDYEKPEEPLLLPPEHKLLLYRLAQELLTNMAKYSRARNLKIGFRKKAGDLEFYYQDDGVGFKYDQAKAIPRRRKGDEARLGLLGLKERVELLDGTIRIDTAPGKGMRVVVRIGV